MTHNNVSAVTFKSSEKHILNGFLEKDMIIIFFKEQLFLRRHEAEIREKVSSPGLQSGISASLVPCPFAIPALSPR